ncbi:DUF6891 domain-containing protein [Anatilimnocola floriformis]|uniref:DUF6891 domain-containing protein n=1 Tax=Anatilimnocola floriformis TaxID=2948575 RepID=UPI0020C3DDF3|nr:hypothetical protein [Anatilimnocola floriformis]
MSDTDDYILQKIKTYVWSGFYSPEEVDSMIDDILEEDANEAMLRAAVEPEFAAKAAAEEDWPEETDCDRLDGAFEELNDGGIIALHNAGYTMSDGLSDVSEELHERGRDQVRGFCFYHGQDLERAVDGGGLMLAFGAIPDEPAKNKKIGELLKYTLEEWGFTVEWSGDVGTRLSLPTLDWKRSLEQSEDEDFDDDDDFDEDDD